MHDLGEQPDHIVHIFWRGLMATAWIDTFKAETTVSEEKKHTLFVK